MKKSKEFLIKKVIIFTLLFSTLVVCSIVFFKPYVFLTIETDRKFNLSIFYDNGSVEGYPFDDEHLSKEYSLSGGIQTVRISIPKDGMKRLRIDFGDKSCNVAIYRMVLCPSFLYSYFYSAEDIFQNFTGVNDISKSECKDNVVTYNVSGTDGHIAALEPKLLENAKKNLNSFMVIVQVIGILLISAGITFGRLFYQVVKCMRGRVSFRILHYCITVLVIEVSTVSMCPQYWGVCTLFAITVGCSLYYVIEYISSGWTLKADYRWILLGTIIAFIPMFLTGFAYGDAYVSNMRHMSFAHWVSYLSEMKRPFVGIVQGYFNKISVENSNLFRVFIGMFFAVYGIVLYQFALKKFNSRWEAFSLSFLMCASIIAVDSVAYIAIFPIIFSLLFSTSAYLAWECFMEALTRRHTKKAFFEGLIFVFSLLAAFCMYQIGTPVFFVLLIMSILDKKTSDKGIIKKGIEAVFGYGIVALSYMMITAEIQKIYNFSNVQSARAQFIHTLPQITEKVYWFCVDVIPQSAYRICASVLPGVFFKTKNLFYVIEFKNSKMQIVALATIFSVIAFGFLRMLFKKQWQKVVGCLCGILLSFYPFLILPESVILTYYMIPLIMILAVYFLYGLQEIALCAKVCSRRYTKSIFAGIISVLILNSALYSNNWTMYCRDSYQYMKQYILSCGLEEIHRIHVIGSISPYVGGNPYVIAAVERILEEEGRNPMDYIITQTDDSYRIDQISEEIAQNLTQALSENEYQRFIKHYEYSTYYGCYSLKSYEFSLEEKEFMRKCLVAANLIPNENDTSSLIISLEGFQQSHVF